MDTMSWWIGSDPIEVTARCLGRSRRGPGEPPLRRGSLATITYLTNAHRRFPKETFEASSAGRTARLDNFKRATVWTGTRAHTRRRHLGRAQTRANRQRSRPSSQSVRNGGPMPISLDSLTATTRATLAAAARMSASERSKKCDFPASGPDGATEDKHELGRARVAYPETLEDVSLRSEVAASPTTSGAGGGRPSTGRARNVIAGVDAPSHRRWLGVLDPARDPAFRTSLAEEVLQAVPDEARRRVLAAGEEVLAGRWELLGTLRQDMEDPDWFFDPVTGRRAPQFDYCFKVNHRSEDVTGNVKQIWELSRMHHVTVLAAAFGLSGDERYAERAASASPLLVGAEPVPLRACTGRAELRPGCGSSAGSGCGVCSTPGREQRAFRAQRDGPCPIWWHQHYLASFRSRGSSANNHVIAEAAGLLVAALAFDWFAESPRWAADAARDLEQELGSNTFPSGVNREMAFDYHGFVAELGSSRQRKLTGPTVLSPTTSGTCSPACSMSSAASVDVKLRRAASTGDGDNGMALVLDSDTTDRWPRLLAIGEDLFDPPSWWPAVSPTVTSTFLGINGRSSIARSAPGATGRVTSATPA